jgi:hypothetical protein
MANSQGMAVETVAAQHGGRGATAQYRTRSMLGITLRRLARSYSALWGLCMVCGLMVIAALAGVIAPYGPAEIVPGGGEPGPAHLGTSDGPRPVGARRLQSGRV